MSVVYSGDKITFADSSVQSSAPIGFKNRIINGDFRIDQRNAGASVTPNSSYTLDRWQFANTQTSKATVQQNAGSVTPPAGFVNYLGITSSSAYSIVASDYFIIGQKIEGQNIGDLAWGTANAKTVTLSFWVRSSLTGTFGGSISNSAFNRCYPFSYTVSSANTWEQKSITITGDTTGTWLTTNGIGMTLWLGIGVGSDGSGTAGSWGSTGYYSATGATSVVGTNGATFYITGVQFEVGSTASAFEVRSIGQETTLCQRYYYKQSGATNYARLGHGFCGSGTSTTLYATIRLPVSMRSKPTSLDWTGNLGVWNGGGISSVSAVSLESGSETTTSCVAIVTSSGMTAQTAYTLIGNASSTAALAISSEL